MLKNIISTQLLVLFFVIIFSISCDNNNMPASREFEFAIAIHGGAGTILKENMTPEIETEYRTKLSESLKTGYEILANGGTSLDAVVASIKIMEDSPLFNAGKGAVFNHNGLNELDASIMDGKSLKAGAVGAVRNIKNPIDLARIVMDETKHVMLIGEAANLLAEEHGITLVPDEYFFTDRRWQSLQNALNAESKKDISSSSFKSDNYFGTVGVVALDSEGNLAAGTSTGGLTNKMYGRVGDSPIIGAGTYANNRTCAVSGTGIGEYFMRGLIAYDVSALMEYKHMNVHEASSEVITNKLTRAGGTGGIIAMDYNGNVSMTFNTEGMYRGYYQQGEELIVKIFKKK